MGDAQLLHDVLGADPLLLTPEEAVRLLRGGCKTASVKVLRHGRMLVLRRFRSSPTSSLVGGSGEP